MSGKTIMQTIQEPLPKDSDKVTFVVGVNKEMSVSIRHVTLTRGSYVTEIKTKSKTAPVQKNLLTRPRVST